MGSPFDFIIVGGGSAGCVLANRLSASGRNQVLLCEAGSDLREAAMPPEIADSYGGKVYIDPRFQWPGLKVTTRSSAAGAPSGPWRPFAQGRILGGGSSINGQVANRGAPQDYDEWAARGADGWSWEDVLPYFRKLETDLDFVGDFHGSDGPVDVMRVPPERWSGYSRAAAAAWDAAGVPFLPDQNGEWRDGYFPLVMSNSGGRRVTTATAYLGEAVRRRPNLTLVTDAEVDELLFDGRRCTGVMVSTKDGRRAFSGAEVILSCGAIYTPMQLLRAGVGPAEELRSKGVTVRADRQGVGRGLMEHPIVAIGALLKPEARVPDSTRRHLHVGMRYSSGLVDTPGDMFLAINGRSQWHSIGHQIGGIGIIVNKSLSSDGTVTLADPPHSANPIVNFNLLSDERDTIRLMDGYRRAVALLLMPQLAEAYHEIFPASYTRRVIRYGALGRKNAILTAIGARLLDGPAALRALLVRKMIVGRYSFADLLQDDTALRAFVQESAIGAYHPSCSARMGRKDDPLAVTDARGRVYGVDGLRVVDASIFPTVPCANTNIPTIMCAEKIAADLLAQK